MQWLTVAVLGTVVGKNHRKFTRFYKFSAKEQKSCKKEWVELRKRGFYEENVKTVSFYEKT
jgi:hypothetical protein